MSSGEDFSRTHFLGWQRPRIIFSVQYKILQFSINTSLIELANVVCEKDERNILLSLVAKNLNPGWSDMIQIEKVYK